MELLDGVFCHPKNLMISISIPSGKKFEGLTFYMKNCGLLKIVTHLKFVYNRFVVCLISESLIRLLCSRLNIDSVMADTESSTIRSAAHVKSHDYN